jgi:hypothetical protein
VLSREKKRVFGKESILHLVAIDRVSRGAFALEFPNAPLSA